MVPGVGLCPKCKIGMLWPQSDREIFCWSCGFRGYLVEGSWHSRRPATARIRGSAHDGEGYRSRGGGTFPSYYK